jgi:hypothetical protein
MLTIIGPNYKTPEGATFINTTSRSDTWSRGLSPFFAGPVDLYKGYRSHNVENGWQYSKVFEYYLEADGSVGERYFNWAQKGWNSIRAVRRPMGRGVKPLYSYWDGETLPYIEARKKIYIPLYAKAVQKTSAFAKLKRMYEAGDNLVLWDFDGYDHKALGLSYDQVINDPNRTMGHAFVIGMLLEGFLP